AADRFCELLAGLGASPTAGQVDVRGDLPDRSPVRVRTTRVNGLLGTTLARDEIAGLLEPIGFEVATAPDAPDDLDVVVPSFRYDTATEIDVIEEVARHHGYSRIPQRVPKAMAGRLDDHQQARRQLLQILVGLGLDQAMPM